MDALSAVPPLRPPLVSVCIPAYKGGLPLELAIESVLAQSFRNLELIVVDDNSPDDTEMRLARFSADPRFTFQRNPINLGPQENWNRCLALARGRYFKLLPHDDVLQPECLARQVAVLDADHQQRLAFVFCARRVIGPDGRVIMHRGYPGARTGSLDAKVAQMLCVRKGTNLFGEPGGLLFRRQLASRVGSFDASNPYVVDLDYWFRLLVHGQAYYIDETLVDFRVSPTQWSVRIGGNQSREFCDFVARIAPIVGIRLGWSDMMRARLNATVNSLLRLAFYAYYFRA